MFTSPDPTQMNLVSLPTPTENSHASFPYPPFPQHFGPAPIPNLGPNLFLSSPSSEIQNTAEFLNDDDLYETYNPRVIDLLATAFAKGHFKTTFPLEFNGKSVLYEFDFQREVQTNLDSGKVRRVWFQFPASEAPARPDVWEYIDAVTSTRTTFESQAGGLISSAIWDKRAKLRILAHGQEFDLDLVKMTFQSNNALGRIQLKQSRWIWEYRIADVWKEFEMSVSKELEEIFQKQQLGCFQIERFTIVVRSSQRICVIGPNDQELPVVRYRRWRDEEHIEIRGHPGYWACTENTVMLHDTTAELAKTFQEMINSATKADGIGRGKDSPGLKHSGFQVKKVCENLHEYLFINFPTIYFHKCRV
eukprot:c18919_g2_i2.p1 GENE.c18919_g2_i2~~c18919_g2_i2.p1  ORF type:complete len:362 (+),score=73.80 c18919_g2_i2:84-1169(+)